MALFWLDFCQRWVTFYGNYKEIHKNAVMKMMQKLNETGRNVPIPWLGNRKLEVRFK